MARQKNTVQQQIGKISRMHTKIDTAVGRLDYFDWFLKDIPNTGRARKLIGKLCNDYDDLAFELNKIAAQQKARGIRPYTRRIV